MPQWFEEYDTSILVDCVKYAQSSGISGPCGDWLGWLQARFGGAKRIHRDPARHERQQLEAFLASITQRRAPLEHAQCASSDKPDNAHEQLQQLRKAARRRLKRYARWQLVLRQEAAVLGGGPPPPLKQGDGRTATQNEASTAAGHQGLKSQSGQLPGVAAAVLWELVERTKQHPLYAKHYTFPSYEKGWIRTSRLLPDDSAPSRSTAHLLALDCEMVATERDENALVGICVVDCAGQPLMKELVLPRGGGVRDYRTAVTGLSSASLRGVTTQRRQVAARLRDLLTPNTILVGHSLHKDLTALRLDHAPVIDTALLFSYRGLKHATPSLVQLCSAVLGRLIRQGSQDGVHNSEEDAGAALHLVLHEAQQGPTPPLDPPTLQAAKEDLCKLMVHRIPHGTSVEHIAAAMHQAFVTSASAAAGGSSTGGTMVLRGAQGRHSRKAATSAESSSGHSDESSSGGSSSCTTSSGSSRGGCRSGGEHSRGTPGSHHQSLWCGQDRITVDDTLRCNGLLCGFEGDPATGKALAVFQHAGAADAVFGALAGKAARDSLGRATKVLQLPSGGQVRVRRMACHAGRLFGKDAPADRGARPAVLKGSGQVPPRRGRAVAAGTGQAPSVFAVHRGGKKLRMGKRQREELRRQQELPSTPKPKKRQRQQQQEHR